MKNAKVLIVEDDPIVASDIKQKLRDFGYEVCAIAASGEQAIQDVREHRPAAVLMDITLEGPLDGVQAAEEIRKSFAVPVVFLTAHSDQMTVQRAKLTLPFGYVLKPIRDVELQIALEMAVYTGARTLPRSSEPSSPPSSRGRLKHTEAERREIARVLQSVPPFAKVREALLLDVADGCFFADYKTLETVALEGESSSESEGFLVLSGRVAMLKTSLNGRELAVQLIGPGSSFGLLAGLDSPTRELTARAQTETRVLHVPKAAILYLLSEMPELYADLLAEVSRRLNALHDMARSLAHDRVEVRVAATLSMFLEQSQKGAGNGGDGEVNMSRQELANLSGTTVETAIRVTRAFEKSGIVDLPDHRMIRVLQPEKLRDIGAGLDCESM